MLCTSSQRLSLRSITPYTNHVMRSFRNTNSRRPSKHLFRSFSPKFLHTFDSFIEWQNLKGLLKGASIEFFSSLCVMAFDLLDVSTYPVTEPKHLVVASEVATLDFLRSHDIPVPKVYGYSATSENTAGTEYLFMELNAGANLGDIWFDLPENTRTKVAANLVELESRLPSLEFPANGSLYYTKDLPTRLNKVEISIAKSTCNARFCIGPDTRLGL
jgi:hypothetical protein